MLSVHLHVNLDTEHHKGLSATADPCTWHCHLVFSDLKCEQETLSATSIIYAAILGLENATKVYWLYQNNSFPSCF